MKTKLILLMLLTTYASQSFGIGFPHGLAKKKKTEQIENTKKDSKFEKKVMVLGLMVNFVIEKMVFFKK
jgi:hypothetical protein